MLSQLTQSDRYKLRFDLHLRNGTWIYAEYSTFAVFSEEYNYRLLVSGYSGNAGDALRYHDKMMFTTYDRDNDLWSSNNCAVVNGGGFWYKACSWCAVNTVRGPGDDFRWYSSQIGNLLLQSTRMWLMC